MTASPTSGSSAPSRWPRHSPRACGEEVVIGEIGRRERRIVGPALRQDEDRREHLERGDQRRQHDDEDLGRSIGTVMRNGATTSHSSCAAS